MIAIVTLAAALAAWAGSAAAAPSIGHADLVLIWATGRPPGAPERPVYVQDDVFAQETLRTVEDGALHVIFRDGTELRMGSAATVTLDEFVYDPDAGAGKLLGSVSRGIARFITGRIDDSAFAVRTPAALIGVRGTDFSVWVEEDGRTTVWVNEGAVVVTPRGGAAALVREDETVAVEPGSAALQRDALRPPGDRGLLNPLQIRR